MLLEASVDFSQAAHSLGKASVIEEILFQSFKLFEKQVVSLMYEDNYHVGDGLGRPCFT